MAKHSTPPFRAEHVGSLLRLPGLTEARARWRRGELPTAELQAIENDAIRAVVRRQEDIGLQVVTDGEFRRDWWHLDFLVQLDGVVSVASQGPAFGGSEEQPPIARVTGKVACSRPIMTQGSAFLRSVATATPKTPSGNCIRRKAMLSQLIGPLPNDEAKPLFTATFTCTALAAIVAGAMSARMVRTPRSRQLKSNRNRKPTPRAEGNWTIN